MSSHILRLTAIGILFSSTALAGVIHPPMPTKEHPGDAPPDGVTAPRTIEVDPSAGDVSLTYPAGSTIITPAYTGRKRAAEIINPPKEETAAPVAEVSEVDTDAHEEEDINAPDIYIENNGIRFVSGGIGDHDIAHMKTLEPDFRLKLTFAASSGHYLSNVTVSLTNKEGTNVLTMTTEGPTLLVDLPADSYSMTATYGDAVQTKQVTIGAKGLKGYTVTFTQPVM